MSARQTAQNHLASTNHSLTVSANMKKKNILITILLLISLKSFSCDCDDNNATLEFYASKYVFSGAIISKEYAKDSLTYKITFQVFKHYKEGDSPKKIEFTLTSEKRFTGRWTSCDWNANIYDQWLVYAYIYKGKLRFSGMCSNSQPLGRVNSREQKALDNGNLFNIHDFVYEHERDFNYTNPITNVDNILINGKVKKYTKPYIRFELLISKKGKLKAVMNSKYSSSNYDSVYGLRKKPKAKNMKPQTEFEKEALRLVKQIKKWEIKRHKQTKEAVPYIKDFLISFNQKEKRWKYEK